MLCHTKSNSHFKHQHLKLYPLAFFQYRARIKQILSSEWTKDILWTRWMEKKNQTSCSLSFSIPIAFHFNLWFWTQCQKNSSFFFDDVFYAIICQWKWTKGTGRDHSIDSFSVCLFFYLFHLSIVCGLMNNSVIANNRIVFSQIIHTIFDKMNLYKKTVILQMFCQIQTKMFWHSVKQSAHKIKKIQTNTHMKCCGILHIG